MARFGLLRLCFTAAALASCAAPAAHAAEPAVRSVEVVGTEFRVTKTDGSVLGSEALVGAVLTIAGPNGRPVAVRIDDVERDPKDPDVVLHTFSTRNDAGEWTNMCQADPTGARKGFPMKGTLAGNSEYKPDAPGFSITCTLGVQAKCVRWGYKPWKPDPEGASMVDLYRTCMRMARADYCGDGRPYTKNGMSIDLYDRVGIQKPESEPKLSFEAAWGPQGALCIRHIRVPENGSLEDVVRSCPRLAKAPVGDHCTEQMPGALMFNKSM